MSRPVVKGYIVIGKIGSGSYSTVYKAFKNDGNREVVAIKSIERTRLSRSAVDNIVTEIALLKILKHEYIVEMKDFLWDEKFVYIIMEFCDRGNLFCFIKERRKLSEPVCRKFLQQLAMALKYLRSRNVCHMDLKPQNLMLTSKPIFCLKLGDFGFAQYLSREAQLTTLRGSPLYMAPEMLTMRTYDARVDLWSVGVIMYECLFGRAPFSSNGLAELAKEICARPPIRIPPGNDISPECADLLTRLLQPDPDKRIDYDAFFQHSFLDLEYYPSTESYAKAVRLVSDAVKYDAEKDFEKAFSLYCEALKYFIPLLNAETDPQKKAVFHAKVSSYLTRAEVLKKALFQQDVQKAQSPCSPSLEELRRLCVSSPSLATALELGLAAEQYLAEGQYQLALEKFEVTLGMLLPALSLEPKGPRRDMLHSQTLDWLKQAEASKALSAVALLTEENETETETRESCKVQ